MKESNAVNADDEKWVAFYLGVWNESKSVIVHSAIILLHFT